MKSSLRTGFRKSMDGVKVAQGWVDEISLLSMQSLR